ncbi:unnamed protein product [Acanthoscelides obtectus]|uniref:ABC transmembrane type-2 domain-containing protein n=1 Tax=Acanthoscelides obtectus TaxID=200917 RepID=A0A9P0PGY8_ACAOB|nr:unnamed protein product [Acanthoscelides obtectus]CAK1655145.1 ABC transporter G family member 20 [Acanthoscelides obtectus]
MPQELALYGEFSINETILYFGWIYGLKTKDIKERVRFLVDLLDLPPGKRLVKNLSGGQQRRVSLAVAVLHQPELLILDEPTVGVDPILRANIWNYMVREAKEKKQSIIITTHYIDEARQAQTIGMMRSGEILAENAPEQLLKMYGCTSLEEVFLNLSQQQEIALKADTPTKSVEKQFKVRHEKKSEGLGELDEKRYGCCNRMCNSLTYCISCVRLRALLYKNSIRLVRNLPVLLFIFALPVIQVILFCVCIGNDPKDLTLAVVNKEVNYTNSSYLYCPYDFECTLSINGNQTIVRDWEYMSCGYLVYLDIDTINLEYYPDTSSCTKAVVEGKAWGCMYIKSTFSEALLERVKRIFLNNLLESVKHTTLSEIQVWLDMTNHQIALVLQRDILQGFDNFTKDVVKQCHVDSTLFRPPIRFETVYGSNRPVFTNFAAPGVILTIVFFLAVSLTALALIMERNEGLLGRSFVADQFIIGVTATEILFSHVFTQFIVMVGQTLLALLFMIAVFKVDCIGSMVGVIVMALLQGLCGMCFGFVISAVCTHERNAIQVSLGCFYPTIMLSGSLWPLEAMPKVLRCISWMLPLTLATRAVRSIMLRGWGIEWSHVYWGYVATCAWIAIFMIVAILIVKL